MEGYHHHHTPGNTDLWLCLPRRAGKEASSFHLSRSSLTAPKKVTHTQWMWRRGRTVFTFCDDVLGKTTPNIVKSGVGGVVRRIYPTEQTTDRVATHSCPVTNKRPTRNKLTQWLLSFLIGIVSNRNCVVVRVYLVYSFLLVCGSCCCCCWWRSDIDTQNDGPSPP